MQLDQESVEDVGSMNLSDIDIERVDLADSERSRAEVGHIKVGTPGRSADIAFQRNARIYQYSASRRNSGRETHHF